jgi:hypothetical protein
LHEGSRTSHVENGQRMEQAYAQERERQARESALDSLSAKFGSKIKRLMGRRSTPGSTFEAYRLKSIRLTWNRYYQESIFAVVRVRIEVGQEYPALLENEALDELKQQIIGDIAAVDMTKRKEVEPEFTASGFRELLGDHYLDVARLTAIAQGQIEFARTKRDFLRRQVGLRFPLAVRVTLGISMQVAFWVCLLGPPFIELWLFRHQGPFLARAVNSAIGSFLMSYLFYNAYEDGLKMAMVRPVWTTVHPQRIPLRGPVPGPFRFVMSNFTLSFGFLYFGVLLFGRLTLFKGPDISDRFAWFWSATGSVLFIIFKFGQTGRGRKILLLRRFDRYLAQKAVRVLNPALRAYGEVITVEDKTLRKARNPFVPQMPGFPRSAPLETFTTTDEWQTEVNRRIAESDLIVIDVSEMSHWLAWEYLQSARSNEPRPIILVASTAYLSANRSALFRDFLKELKSLSGDAESLLASIEPPLAYSSSLANVVFTVRLYRRIRRLARLQSVIH